MSLTAAIDFCWGIIAQAIDVIHRSPLSPLQLFGVFLVMVCIVVSFGGPGVSGHRS